MSMHTSAGSVAQPVSMNASAPKLYALMAECENVDALMGVAERVRDAGYRQWECYTPFPVHGLDRAMGEKPTRLPWLVLMGGMAGCMTGVALTWWTMATSFDVPRALRGYEYVISGKPFFSLPAYIPPIFELTILFAAFAAVFGMLGLNQLPQLHHPLFKQERFRRVTDDRFFVVIEADDPQFDLAGTRRLLEEAGASVVEEVEE